MEQPEKTVPPNWWENNKAPEPPPGYPDMIEALRRLQDRITMAVPDPALIESVTSELATIEHRLEGAVIADEWSRLSGRLEDVPGRGQSLIPPVRLTEAGDGKVRGSVRYGFHYLGGNGAVHGGAIPLVFDDVLGRLANAGGRGVSRTAYLHVDFRSVTPVEKDLTVEAWFESETGRKRYLRGTLHDGDRLCAEAEGLFVALRPGQQ